jgi:hypothetical protein
VSTDPHTVPENALVAGLSQLMPGEVPIHIFDQIARLTVTPVVEVVPFYRDEQENIKVYLLQRSAHDPYWPNLHHVPGTIVRATDHADSSFSDPLRRVIEANLAAYAQTKPIFVCTSLCSVIRGLEIAIVFTTELQTAPTTTSLFDPQALPATMIDGQSHFIARALQMFTS